MANQRPLPDLPAGVPKTAATSLANQLNSVAIRLLRSVSEADQVMGLTAPQASLLSVLVFAGPQTIGDLAVIERVSSPAITKHVDNLEAKGLVDRTRSTRDRRVVEVPATDSGTAVLQSGRAERIRVLSARLEKLTPSERRTVEEALTLTYGVL